MKIFVSYTTRDGQITRAFLEQISKGFSEFETVYIDLIHNNSDDKQKRVFDELDLADQIILIETPFVYKSDWVNAELERAQFQKKEILKISLDELQNFLELETETIQAENSGNGRLLSTYIKNSASRC